MKESKRKLSRFLAVCLAAGTLMAFTPGTAVFADEAAAKPICVVVNGEEIAFEDASPVNINGSVLVPMRAIFEALGAEVVWEEETQTVTGILGENQVKTSIGSITGYVNDEMLDLSVPSRLINGRTMVPVRFVSEGLTAEVNWIEGASANTVAITLGDEAMGGPLDQSQNNVQLPSEEAEGEEGIEDAIPSDEEEKPDSSDYSDSYYPVEEGGYYFLQSVIPSGGCLLTCLSMVSSNLHQEMITPEDVYAMNGSVVRVNSWSAIQESLEIVRAETIDFNEVAVEERLPMIVQLIEEYPEGVIIGFCKSGSWHYVVTVGYDEETGDLLVNDPVGGHNVPLEETWTGYKKFASQEEAINYLQNGKTFLRAE